MGQTTSNLYTSYKQEKSTNIDNNSNTDNKEGSLKLAAQKVTDFGGGNEEWRKWKSKTSCAFEGSSYDKILIDKHYSETHPKMNKIVYSQLAAATIDGTANHLVTKYSDTCDGHSAWKELLDWYDGDIVRAETAEELRSKLNGLFLTQGTHASSYINKFLVWLGDLNKIPEENFSPSHGVSLFLHNIQDDDYKTTVGILKMSNEQDIMKCFQAIGKRERELIRACAEKCKLRQHVRRLCNEGYFDANDLHPPAKLRRLEGITLTGDIKTNDWGYISISKEQYRNLANNNKQFIKDYNQCVKAGKSTNTVRIPQGINIIPTTARRLNIPPNTDTSQSPDNSSDDDTPSASPGTSPSKKRITFDLNNVEDNDES